MMERSLALKSPSIHYHLAGTKKVRMMMTKNCGEQLAHILCCQVQQELAKPGQLERFLGDKPEVKINKFKSHHGF